jgi:ubiquinol-cytochrome c reductase iron-sulfur subunit
VSWTVDGIIAYSKLCTHAGCPVGLYVQQLGELLCPCHQSVFDILAGATPVAGPAARPLPQLPIAVGADGTLVARGDFSAPVGPGYWSRS